MDYPSGVKVVQHNGGQQMKNLNYPAARLIRLTNEMDLQLEGVKIKMDAETGGNHSKRRQGSILSPLAAKPV